MTTKFVHFAGTKGKSGLQLYQPPTHQHRPWLMQYAGVFKLYMFNMQEIGQEVPPLNFYPRCDIAEVSLALAHSSLEEVTNHSMSRRL